MIFVDASAMISMMTGASDADRLADRLEAERQRLCSAISVWETIAGLCRTDEKVGEAWTMLTTEPGPDVQPYHNRQIVVLKPEDFARWLDPAVPAREVLKPLPAGSLDVEQIC